MLWSTLLYLIESLWYDWKIRFHCFANINPGWTPCSKLCHCWTTCSTLQYATPLVDTLKFMVLTCFPRWIWTELCFDAHAPTKTYIYCFNHYIQYIMYTTLYSVLQINWQRVQGRFDFEHTFQFLHFSYLQCPEMQCWVF